MKTYEDWDYGKESYVYNLIDDKGLSYEKVAENFEKKFNEKISILDIAVKFKELTGEKITLKEINKLKQRSGLKNINPADKIAKVITGTDGRGRKKSFPEKELKEMSKDMDTLIKRGYAPTKASKELATKYKKGWTTIYSAYRDYNTSDKNKEKTKDFTSKTEPIQLDIDKSDKFGGVTQKQDESLTPTIETKTENKEKTKENDIIKRLDEIEEKLNYILTDFQKYQNSFKLIKNVTDFFDNVNPK